MDTPSAPDMGLDVDSDRRDLRMFHGMDIWTKCAVAVLLASFVVAVFSAWAPLSDSAAGAVFVAVRVANVAVICFWGARWALRWRRTRSDAVTLMELGPAAQWLLRVCVGVVYGLLVLAAVAGGGIVDAAPAVRLSGFGLFVTAGLGIFAVLIVEHIASARQMRADHDRFKALMRELLPENGETPETI